MQLWLRYRRATALAYDERVDVASQAQWRELVLRPQIVSSILWPGEPRFLPAGRSYRHRRHTHEKGYRNEPARNRSCAAENLRHRRFFTLRHDTASFIAATTIGFAHSGVPGKSPRFMIRPPLT
jgi:hypothetical protein